MTQVNPDNILAVRNSIRVQAEEVQRILQSSTYDLQIRECGGDPISADATPMFMRKIGEILDVHWKHLAELREAVDRLTKTAQSYGYTEQQIKESLAKFKAAL